MWAVLGFNIINWGPANHCAGTWVRQVDDDSEESYMSGLEDISGLKYDAIPRQVPIWRCRVLHS